MDIQQLDMVTQVGRIIYHVIEIMDSGQVEQGSQTWLSLEQILDEVCGGLVYHRRRMGGGKGGHARK